MLVAQSCLTLCDPVDCSLPGSSVHGILQTGILEWVAIAFCRGSSDPGIEPRSPALWAFPGSSPSKESTCNAGDPDSIPESGSSPGEGIGYGLQYSWASLVAQLVKNPPAMWETPGWFLGQEDPLEEGMAIPSSILAWRIPRTEEPGGLQSTGSQRVRHDWAHTGTHTRASCCDKALENERSRPVKEEFVCFASYHKCMWVNVKLSLSVFRVFVTA